MAATTALRWLRRGRGPRKLLADPSVVLLSHDCQLSYEKGSVLSESNYRVSRISLEENNTVSSSSLAYLRQNLEDPNISSTLNRCHVNANHLLLSRTFSCTMSTDTRTETDRYPHQGSHEENQTDYAFSKPNLGYTENLVLLKYSESSVQASSGLHEDEPEAAADSDADDVTSRWTRGQWKVEAWEAWNKECPPCDVTLHGRASLSPGEVVCSGLKLQPQERSEAVISAFSVKHAVMRANPIHICVIPYQGTSSVP